MDCLIVSVARRHDANLLAQDGDLSCVAHVVGIQLDKASLEACVTNPGDRAASSQRAEIMGRTVA